MFQFHQKIIFKPNINTNS